MGQGIIIVFTLKYGKFMHEQHNAMHLLFHTIGHDFRNLLYLGQTCREIAVSYTLFLVALDIFNFFKTVYLFVFRPNLPK